MSGKGGKSNASDTEEKLAVIQTQVEKKIAGLTKTLSKKCKLNKEATHVLLIKLVDAQYAMDFQEQVPLNMDMLQKVGSRHELHAIAAAADFNREQLENLLAFFNGATPNLLREYWSSPRMAHLQNLAVQMNNNFNYTQAVSFKYGIGLKRLGDCFAKQGGGMFAKAWRAKSAASIFSKLYFRRGSVARGWLSDALQGRVTCDSAEAVQQAAQVFQNILTAQLAAARDCGRPGLSAEPTGDQIQRYDVSGLVDSEGRALDRVGTWLSDMSDDEANAIGKESVVVYRVRPCSCCREIDGLAPGEVIVVNLTLMCAPARRVGLVYRLPEQNVVCTFEIQIGTANAFKQMTKSLEAHDRARLFNGESTLPGKLQALAGGAQGKVTQPTQGKNGAMKGGNAERGKRMLDLFQAIDVTHPMPEHAEVVTLSAEPPEVDKATLYERDREMPGSRWFLLWVSKAPVFAIQALTLKCVGKIPPLGRFSLLLTGVQPDGATVTLCEELLSRLPVVRGEAAFVQDGFLVPSGQLLGKLSAFKTVMLEYFEHQRTSQWLELTDINVKVIMEAAQPDKQMGLPTDNIERTADGT